MADLRVVAAGGVSVDLGGEMRGVAGDRCVASTLVERRECIEEKEPRLAEGSASAIDGLAGVLEGLGCGIRDDSSVGSASSIASSSVVGMPFAAGESDKVKPR